MPIFRRHASLTGEWRDGRLQPSLLASDVDAKVWFALPDEGEQVWEALNARTIDADTFELRGVPALAYGVRFGDAVSVVRSLEGSLVVDGIRVPSTSATFRIWIADDAKSTWQPLAEAFAKLGCLVDVYSTRLIALACPMADVDVVRAELEARSEASGISWEQSA